MEIRFPVGQSGQVLVFGKRALNHITRFRQSSEEDLEAGGQLFARFEDQVVTIIKATGPRRTDIRTRTTYIPNRVAEQREIIRHFRRGLHYVGDWHTHPQDFPKPSDSDLESIKECFLKSVHHLNAFVLVIVGIAALPQGIHVSLNNRTNSLHLPGSTVVLGPLID